ncbi:hypothetical protein TIFTF001_030841 [Ficus carica]|uniref:Uncharacterized protein n=1 Tax=Ficus carica TaxID=3494 RepID=A0AA88J094_FICCA|nr:hypothetical protein TIFTF001_030841 [Ficus carica]
MLSGYTVAKGFANQMADEVKAANTDARHARRAEKEARTAKEAAEEARKEAEDRAKVAEERAKEAEGRQWFAEDLVQKADQAVEEAETSKAELEEALHKAEQELASARVEHERYVRVALPAALEEARAQAMADFLGSEDFNECVAQMYREGMRDMKAGFTAANPSLVGVDWSFVPTKSEETVAEEPPEEGEVTGTVRELGDVIILDDQVTEPEQPAPAESVQAAATAEPEPDQSATVVSADQEQDLTLWSENHRSWDACKDRWILFGLPFWVARSRDLTLRSENHRSWGAWQMLGPARAPLFGQCSVTGPDSVVREPQELGVCKGRCWVLLGHLLSMLAPARAPPFGRYPVMGPDSVVREPQELSARADVWSCSGTSYGWLGFSIGLTQVQLWSAPSMGTFLSGLRRGGTVHRRWWSFNIIPGETWFPGKFYPGYGEVPTGSSMVPGEVLPGSRGSATRVKHVLRR